MRGYSILPVFTAVLFASAAAAEPASYSGYQTRSIKALSSEEIAELEAGRGMQFALAAELNHYPGPSHILTVSDELRLSDEQRAATSGIFQRMEDAAKSAGRDLIAAEERLNRAFSEALVTEAALTALVDDAADLRGGLRRIHLAAHLETRSLLTPEQIQTYDRLRGYGDAERKERQPGNGHN